MQENLLDETDHLMSGSIRLRNLGNNLLTHGKPYQNVDGRDAGAT
jgi:hypothetical protein